jgi:hypothetical protein
MPAIEELKSACPYQKPCPAYFIRIYSHCTLRFPHVKWLSFYFW